MLLVIISADNTESVTCLRAAYAIFGDQIWSINCIAPLLHVLLFTDHGSVTLRIRFPMCNNQRDSHN